ncbi:MAG TPA: hypothetical protein VGF99_16810 [Myxococcota bacterium]
MIAALVLVMALAGAGDARVKDAEGFAAHGEPATALAAYGALLDELHASGASGSAALHYNIGTLALGSGDVGTAVLHLLAAQRRDPLDDDIRHNLAAALSRRADQVEGDASLPAGASLPPGVARVTCGSLLALAGILFALAGLRRGRARPLVFAGVLAALVGLGVLAVRAAAERAVVVVVMTDTEARPQPEDSAAGFAVHPGLTGAVVGEQQGYTRVRLENGVDVWVSTSATAVVP